MVVVLGPGSGLTVEAIQEYCRSRLASFSVPTIVELRHSLPKTPVGKIEESCCG